MDKVEKRSQKSVVEIKPETCRLCGNGDNIAAVEIPYVFKFLVTQLSSMNINVKLNYNESL
jgi:DNA-directed RNA polymerase I subunit RPA2